MKDINFYDRKSDPVPILVEVDYAQIECLALAFLCRDFDQLPLEEKRLALDYVFSNVNPTVVLTPQFYTRVRLNLLEGQNPVTACLIAQKIKDLYPFSTETRCGAMYAYISLPEKDFYRRLSQDAMRVGLTVTTSSALEPYPTLTDYLAAHPRVKRRFKMFEEVSAWR